MLFIWGWIRPFTVLGHKIEDCLNCGNVGAHAVGRRSTWGTIFWIPLLFLGFQHGMLCPICSTWTKLRWADVRRAGRTGQLHLDRARPHAQAVLAAAADDGAPPLSPAVFDDYRKQTKRGGWDLYLKAYPVVIVGIVLLSVLAAAVSPPKPVASPSTTWTSHDCWAAADGSLNGCRMKDGSLVGVEEGSPLTCYFAEPMPMDKDVSCRAP